jgi:peptide/nickel transport system substrate-binding protein
MELFPSTRVQFITLNVRPTLADGTVNPLADERVRQAINHGLDKDAIIALVTHGVGTPSSSYMSSTTPYHTGEGAVFPYDPEKAKALLAEAGYGDGVTISMLVLAGNQDEAGIAAAAQQMWAQIGVTLQIEQVDNATRTDRYRTGNFQMRIAAWTNDINDPSQITSYFVYYPTIEALHSGWNNDEANQLYEASQQEADPAVRAGQYARIQEIYNTAAPIVMLYETPYPVALQASVEGFVQIPLGNNIFSGVHIEK